MGRALPNVPVGRHTSTSGGGSFVALVSEGRFEPLAHAPSSEVTESSQLERRIMSLTASVLPRPSSAARAVLSTSGASSSTIRRDEESAVVGLHLPAVEGEPPEGPAMPGPWTPGCAGPAVHTLIWANEGGVG